MTIALPAVLDTPAAAALRQTLRDAIGSGQPIRLDASGVERIGQACLQVLAAAEVAAEESGQEFRIVGASPVFANMATLAALDTLIASINPRLASHNSAEDLNLPTRPAACSLRTHAAPLLTTPARVHPTSSAAATATTTTPAHDLGALRCDPARR